MKKSLLSLFSLIALIGLAMPVTAATTKAKPSTTPPPAADAKTTPDKADAKTTDKKRDTMPVYGEVVSITETLLTIKGGKDKPDRKFDMNKETRIHNDEKPATIADVKVGSWIGGNAKIATAGGNPLLLSLNIGVKQKAAPKTEAPKSVTPKAPKKGN